MAVKANSGITSIQQLAGRTVVTTSGTTSVQHLRKHERATGLDFKEVYGKDHADSFLLLETGRADAYVIDGAMLASLIATSKNPKDFVVAGEVLNIEPIAIMMRKDDPAFKKIANHTIETMAASGALRDLWTKWYLSPIPPKGVAIGLQTPASIKAAWANLNDKPMEDYQQTKVSCGWIGGFRCPASGHQTGGEAGAAHHH
jgi:glutamate/aspartate transport system substrate-binding protein